MAHDTYMDKMDVLAAVDARMGALIESATNAHHHRRLRRVGWERAYSGDEDGWAKGSIPIRPGNHVDVHVDGAAALPSIAASISAARSSVHVAGWAITPSFRLERGQHHRTLRSLLAEAAERVPVRVLVWGGSPIPVLHPTRSETEASVSALIAGTRIQAARDTRNRPMHCHHEKLVIVDDETAFVGGIDLTDIDGDRFDAAPHSIRRGLGWHDAAVALTGPSVADVAEHFALRWQATTGERLAPVSVPDHTGSSRVQVVRTVPEGNYAALPRGDFSVLESYIGALRGAQRLIYLENQFLWSVEIVAVLRQLLDDPPSADFRLCIVLPQRPNNGNDDTRGQLSLLHEADRHHRLLAGTVGPTAPSAPPVYVHAKVGIVDDRWVTVGSANLNEHSLFNDTEVNVVSDDAQLARTLRDRLWSEHLEMDCSGQDPLVVLEEVWRPRLADHSGKRHRLRALPAVSRRSARLMGPLKGLLVDG